MVGTSLQSTQHSIASLTDRYLQQFFMKAATSSIEKSDRECINVPFFRAHSKAKESPEQPAVSEIKRLSEIRNDIEEIIQLERNQNRDTLLQLRETFSSFDIN
jgi:hypothetical protein